MKKPKFEEVWYQDQDKNRDKPIIPEVLCPETLAAMDRQDLEWLILDQEKTIQWLLERDISKT